MERVIKLAEVIKTNLHIIRENDPKLSDELFDILMKIKDQQYFNSVKFASTAASLICLAAALKELMIIAKPHTGITLIKLEHEARCLNEEDFSIFSEN